MNKAIKNQETIGNWVFPVKIGCNYSTFGVTLDGRNFNKQHCDTLLVTSVDTTLFDTFPGAELSGFVEQFAGNIVSNPSTVTAVRVIGVGNIGMYKYVHLETASYTLSFSFDNTNLGTGGVRAQLLDSASNTLLYNSTGFLSDGNYSFTLPAIAGGTYKVQFEYLVVSGSHNFYIDNLCLSYVDTNTVINCDGKGDYRYSWQGAEKLDELNGENNSLDFGARIYNPLIGRPFTMDALTHSFPFYSPYQFCSNNPILSIDLDGMESVIRLNYPEASIVIRKNSWGALEVTSDQLRLINPTNDPNRTLLGGNGGQQIVPGGNVNAWCPNCKAQGGKGAWVDITIAKQPVITVTKSPTMETCEVEGERLIKAGTESEPHPVSTPITMGGVRYTLGGKEADPNSVEGKKFYANEKNRAEVAKIVIDQIKDAIAKNPTAGTPKTISLTMYINNPELEKKLVEEAKKEFGVTPTINHNPVPDKGTVVGNASAVLEKTIPGSRTPGVYEKYKETVTEPTGGTTTTTTSNPPVEIIE